MADTLVYISHPSDGVTTFQRARVERAPDVAGAPGAFTEITNILLDSNADHTNYTDTAGTSTDWYRYRWANTAGTVFSDYSPSRQAGDYKIREWIKADIPDADITNTDWDRWRDQVFSDLALQGLGKITGTLYSWTPASNTDEWQNIDGRVSTVLQVDIYKGSDKLTTLTDWYQVGRKIRIPSPRSTWTYKYWGVEEIRNIGDLSDEMFNIVYWGMRLKYLFRRLADRQNFKFYLSADKTSDITITDLEKMAAEARSEYEVRLASVKSGIGLPTYRA